MPQPGSKPTIAVDIDDVLAANAEGFVKFSNERWGTRLTPDDYTEHWAEMWNVGYDEENKRRDIIVQEKVFLNHSFLPDAQPVLKKLARKYKLVIVSSRGRSVQSDTKEWLRKEYRGLFSEIHFAQIWDQNLPTADKLRITKAEICREIGADYLIDDQPKHCIAAAQAGITAILFGDYGWNRSIKLSSGMKRARSWKEVEEFFDAESR